MRAPSRLRDQKHPCCVSGDQERTSAAENKCQSRGCDWSSAKWALCSYTQRSLLAAHRSCCERQGALGEIRGLCVSSSMCGLETFWQLCSASWTAIRTVLNVRYGSLWTPHRARTMGRPYITDLGTITNGSCPLCLTPLDSAGHLLGKCSHRDIKSMHIARNNKAVSLLQDAIAVPWGAATWLWMHVAETQRLLLLPPHASHPGCCPQCLQRTRQIAPGYSHY